LPRRMIFFGAALFGNGGPAHSVRLHDTMPGPICPSAAAGRTAACEDFIPGKRDAFGCISIAWQRKIRYTEAMNKNRCMLFFDVDGTLVTEDTHTVPTSAADAIRRARARGHLAFVNTGRPYTHIEPQVLAIGFDGTVCSGGLYIRLQDTIVQDVVVPAALCRTIRDLSRTCRVETTYESKEGVCYDLTRPLSAENERERHRLGRMGVHVSTDVDSPSFRFEKFLAWKSPAADMDAFLAAIGRYFHAIDRYAFYECVPLGYTKATGIRTVVSRLGGDMARTFAFGDGPNDLEMLGCAGTSVLMGNAVKELHEKAYFVTKRIDEDGIAFALRHFGLID